MTVKKPRWEIIQNALLQPILTSRDLEKAILSYNTKYAKQWKFYALHELFEEVEMIFLNFMCRYLHFVLHLNSNKYFPGIR